MKIVCRYKKTITMNSVYELERLVSNCSVSNAETSSMYETETTFVIPKACSDDRTVIIVGTKNGHQNAYQVERPNCLQYMKNFTKEKPYNDPLQNQKEPTESLISEVKNPLDEQLHGPSEESNKNITEDQDNIHDGQDFLLTNVTLVNLEESLQSSLIEKVPNSQGKTSPKVSNDKKTKRTATSKNDSQNFGKKNTTEFRKRTQNLQREFNHHCWLISDLLNLLHPKVSPRPLEPKANQEDIHLPPLQLIVVTHTLAERISRNPSFRRILMAKDLSQIRCYNCNKTGHIARYCRNRKKSNCISSKFGHNSYKHRKRPSSGPNIQWYKGRVNLLSLFSNLWSFSCGFWVKSVFSLCFHSTNVET